MLFSYEAYDAYDTIVHGSVEASDRAQVVEHLRKKDLSPIEIKKISENGGVNNLLSLSVFERISTLDVIALVRDLAVTLKAGLSMTESIDIIIADSENIAMKHLLIRARSDLNNGLPLSKSLEQERKNFPSIFLGMLKAGEYSGQLDKTLGELSNYLSKEYSLTQKVKSAIAYPVILLVASFFVVGILLIFVLPQLARVFATSGVQLPATTQFFMALSGFFSKHYVFDFVLFAGLAWFFTGFRNTETGRKVFYNIFSRIPVARDIIKKVLLIRFSRSFGNLIHSGVSAVESLELSADAIGNHVYKKVILLAAEEVKNGIAISKVFAEHPSLFPAIFTNLMVVGERTGTLGQVLSDFADFYDEDIENKLKGLTSMLEPLLLLFMGLFIGAIAFSILMPIYQLVGKFV